MATVERVGYIPAGGLWTADRKVWYLKSCHKEHGCDRIIGDYEVADCTVKALAAALRDQIAFGNRNLSSLPAGLLKRKEDEARALLAALGGKP